MNSTPADQPASAESRAGRAPVVVAGMLLLMVTVAFLILFFSASGTLDNLPPTEPPSQIAYRARVDALLANADVRAGDSLLNTYGCAACHSTLR